MSNNRIENILVKSKFVEMFEKNSYKKQTIENLCFDGRGRVINQDYIRSNSGKYPVYSSQTTNQGIFGFIDTFDFDGEYVTWTTDGANAGTVFYRNGKFNCTNVCGTLKAKSVNINMIYLSFALGMVAKDHVSHVGNDKLMNEAVKKILIPVPPKELQDKFASYVEEIDKLKFDDYPSINNMTFSTKV